MTTPCYSPRLDAALALAANAFRGVRRKTTDIPYLTHLLAVCALVGEHGGSEDQLIAALLHDYLEDIPGSTAEELEARFGAQVAQWVVDLSDTTESPKPPWRPRKEAYLRTLRSKSPQLKLISAADKLHNCLSILRDHRAVGDDIYTRFTGKKDGTLWYYACVVDALAEDWKHPLLHELARAVAALHRNSGEPVPPSIAALAEH